LTNVQVVHQRVEDHAQEAACSYDWVLARGYATLAQCWAGARPLLRPNGALLAMKGKHPGEELEELTKLGENARAEAVEVPGLDEDRHLVTVRQGPRAHSQNMHRPGGG
nr:class I SAM-dependent methyltransferase [Gammaproteobacteria bacterium]